MKPKVTTQASDNEKADIQWSIVLEGARRPVYKDLGYTVGKILTDPPIRKILNIYKLRQEKNK